MKFNRVGGSRWVTNGDDTYASVTKILVDDKDMVVFAWAPAPGAGLYSIAMHLGATVVDVTSYGSAETRDSLSLYVSFASFLHALPLDQRFDDNSVIALWDKHLPQEETERKHVARQLAHLLNAVFARVEAAHKRGGSEQVEPHAALAEDDGVPRLTIPEF